MHTDSFITAAGEIALAKALRRIKVGGRSTRVPNTYPAGKQGTDMYRRDVKLNRQFMSDRDGEISINTPSAADRVKNVRSGQARFLQSQRKWKRKYGSSADLDNARYMLRANRG